MSLYEASNSTEESPRRYVVGLRNVQTRLWETDEAHAFIEKLRRAEDSRLEINPPLGTHIAFAQERDQWDILCLPEPENKIRTAHSLGDEETTVFISEFGELVSFGKFLGLGLLGTILVEPPVLSESHREGEFIDILDGRLPGVGLHLKDRKESKEQKIDYVHDRWPRVSYQVGEWSISLLTRESSGNLDIKVQFMVHQGVVAQQYLINNPSGVLSTCEFNLDLGFCARPSTVGYWWDNDQQPLSHGGISSTAGGYGAMFWAGDGRGQVQVAVGLFQDGRSVKLDFSKHRPRSSEGVGDRVFDQPESVHESNAETLSPYHLHTVKTAPGVTQELTAIYSLERYSLTREQEQALQPKNETEADNKLGRKKAAPEDGANKSQSIRSASIEESTNGVVSVGLNDTVNNRSKEDESAQEDSFWNYDGDNMLDDLESRINKEELSKLGAKIPDQHFLSPGPQYIDVSMLLKDSYRGNWTLKSKSTPIARLLRRHLQQVLFVNSVSVPRQEGLRSAIVLSEAHIISNTVPIWGSLCMFRFLLSMYAFLDRPEVVDLTLRDYLKCQIKDKCERHLDWSFDVSRPLHRGWASDYNPNGSYSKTEENRRPYSWYYGAIQFIKLEEFRMVFQTLDDQNFVLQKLQKRLGPWCESLEKSRDPKSDMWVSWYTDVNIEWLDPQYRQDENVLLPQYIVSNLVVLWKALSFVSGVLGDANLMVSSLVESGTSESTTSEVNNKLDALKASLPRHWRKTFSPSKLRTKIMDHFTYDHVQDPREPGANTKDAATQEAEVDSDEDTIEDVTGEAGAHTKEAAALEEVRGNKDTVEDSAKKIKDVSARYVRHRKKTDLVRRKRVLVLRWAGNDKPRYLWYSWASPMFEAVSAGFFKDESSFRVWKDTLEAQVVHQELSWEKVMRYALALRAAQYGKSLDVTMNAAQMRKRVLGRLLKCFYSNGTFPTRLSLTSKQPTSKWWDNNGSQSVFEVPLLLLQEEANCVDVAAFLAASGGSSHRNLIVSNNSTLRQGPVILKVRADRNTQDTNSTEDDLDIDPEVVAKERARLAKSATHFARSTKIDRANVRDPPDFEPDWLFPYPDCFASDEPTDTYEEIREQTRKTVENLRQMLQDFEEPSYKVLELGIDKYYSTEAGKEGFTFPESLRPWRATVVDVGQASHSRMPDSFFGYEMEIRLLSKRTLKLAKKRLTIIDSCQPEQALLLYLGSAESEKLSTAGFLTRHNMREDFVKDHAHKEVNLWTTELHLSFYKKIIITSDQSRSMPAIEESIFESLAKLSAFPGKSKSSLDKIQKGTIGWRFSGDLHDRRWTGTILAFVPGREDTNWIESSDLTSDKGFHGQRKIIEARLFAEMTKTIHVSTREVLRDLDAVLDGGEGAIYKGSSEYHDPFSESFDQSYSRSKLYLQLSDFLSHLDDSFKSTMETIEAYMDREQQRLVQPRWSVGDERQHRPELQKWDREGKKNVALLRSVRNEVGTKMSRVKHLRESLNADMQLREARLQARSAEDVRLFTYVTIVFLPISFSSSLFSMSKAPDDSLVGTFAKVAVIALVITLVILFNLKTMSRNMWTYVNAGQHKISDTMSISSWKFWKDTHEELVQAEKRNIQSDEPLQIRKMSKWWYCLFFLAFVLSELPALRVQSAWDIVSPPIGEDPKQPGLFRKILVVILGLLFLPLFVFVFTILFFLRNFIDLFRLYKEKSIQGSKRPTDRSEDSKLLKINKVEYKDDNVASDRKKVEEANWTSDAGQKEEYIARIARLTHPPRLYISSATASDRLDKGGQSQDKDQDFEVEANEVEGEKDLAVRTKIRTVRVLDRLRWKASPKKESQTARKEPDIESNAERRSRVGHGVAVD